MKEKLINICTPRQWRTISTSELKDEGFTVYGANGVIGYYNEYNHEAETVMVTCRGATCGTVNISKPYSYINGNAMCMDDLRHDIDVKYLYYALKNYDFKEVISGSAQPQITRQGLNNVFVEIVDKPIQLEIVKVLSNVEETISRKEQQLQEYDQLIKSRFVELFGDPESNTKKYPMVNLSDIAQYFNGLTYSPENVSDEGIIVLRSSNIQNSKLDFNNLVRVRLNVKESKMVKENDILMCSRNGSAKLVGKVALIDNLPERMAFGAFMMIIRSEYYAYLMSYFQMDAFRRQITTGATTTINQITSRMLDNVKLPLPEKNEVKKFELLVKQVDKLKFEVQKSLNETQMLFDSLMQEYFG